MLQRISAVSIPKLLMVELPVFFQFVKWNCIIIIIIIITVMLFVS